MLISHEVSQNYQVAKYMNYWGKQTVVAYNSNVKDLLYLH